ncbi:MAG: CoA transferase [Phaeovulum sp.]|uniref:CaiB/BaiF CoA transferase family protein n=1 Tax=Phaeovulum sp. TaxID=2934796 RepID=UPI0027334805|nr:CoA transferase [Phaeovulum sp.]MDP3862447.1 CoA transferase [Phaeovulum sp.]
MTQPLPLDGIRVIDFTHFLAGPHLSRSLAAMGADVIKVERPKGGDAGRQHPYFKDGQSGYFLQQNMGKRGLCLNLKEQRGMDLMKRLAQKADVFVENFRPGALTKLGLGYADLVKDNPGLVYCSISAFGHTGPKSDQPGFGLIAEAISGAMAQLGEPDQAPPLMRMPIADMYTGMHGVAAVNAALLGRVKSGKGRHIDLALYDCMVSMHDYAVQQYFLSGGKVMPKKHGSRQPESTVYGAFRAKDGDLVIAAQVDNVWARLANVIGGKAEDERFRTPAGRNDNHAEVYTMVEDWAIGQDGVAHCIAQLDAAQVPCAPVQTVDQIVRDPQILARGMLIEQDHPVLGKVTLPNLPFRFSDCDTTPKCPAPLLGQHNAEIARELDYGAAEIAAMTDDGVLYAEEAAR